MDRSKQVISSCENELTGPKRAKPVNHYLLVPALPVIERFEQLIGARSAKVLR